MERSPVIHSCPSSSPPPPSPPPACSSLSVRGEWRRRHSEPLFSSVTFPLSLPKKGAPCFGLFSARHATFFNRWWQGYKIWVSHRPLKPIVTQTDPENTLRDMHPNPALPYTTAPPSILDSVCLDDTLPLAQLKMRCSEESM